MVVDFLLDFFQLVIFLILNNTSQHSFFTTVLTYFWVETWKCALRNVLMHACVWMTNKSEISWPKRLPNFQHSQGQTFGWTNFYSGSICIHVWTFHWVYCVLCRTRVFPCRKVLLFPEMCCDHKNDLHQPFKTTREITKRYRKSHPLLRILFRIMWDIFTVRPQMQPIVGNHIL